jgi:hypothetical protein
MYSSEESAVRIFILDQNHWFELRRETAKGLTPVAVDATTAQELGAAYVELGKAEAYANEYKREIESTHLSPEEGRELIAESQALLNKFLK